MREFENFEQIKMKCPICGSRNKIYTELIDVKHKTHRGYTIKCCHCGWFGEFYNSHEKNGSDCKDCQNTIVGRQKCYRWTFCPHKDCRLYNTCNIHKFPEDQYKESKAKEKKDNYPYCQEHVTFHECNSPRFL